MADEPTTEYVSPPDGWFDFGHHVDIPGPLEFSTEVDDVGMPLWERPYPPAPLLERHSNADRSSSEEVAALSGGYPPVIAAARDDERERCLTAVNALDSWHDDRNDVEVVSLEDLRAVLAGGRDE